MTWEQFQHHYRELTRSRLEQLLNERKREVKEWEQVEEDKRRAADEARMDRMYGGREARLKAKARWRAEEEAAQPFRRECELMAQSLPRWKYLEWWREQRALGRTPYACCPVSSG